MIACRNRVSGDDDDDEDDDERAVSVASLQIVSCFCLPELSVLLLFVGVVFVVAVMVVGSNISTNIYMFNCAITGIITLRIQTLLIIVELFVYIDCSQIDILHIYFITTQQ